MGRDDPILRFTIAAERYCGLIEAQSTPEADQLLLHLAESLAEVYAAALRLPEIETESGDIPNARLSNDQWRSAFFPFAKVMGGTRDLFADLDDPDAYLLLVSDDLGDIYRDLKEGLLLRADGRVEADVIWQWRFTFWNHWGRHAADALRTITYALSDIGGVGFDSNSAARG